MNKPHTCAICWFRNDLRLSDNPALRYALAHHQQVLCLYIDQGDREPDPGASDLWRYAALRDLAEQLDGRLLYRGGDSLAVLQQLLAEYRVEAVYWNREYDPRGIARDSRVKRQLKADGVRVASFQGNLLFEPWEILKADQSPYRVFTPYYKAAVARELSAPFDTPAPDGRLVDVRFDPGCPTLDALRRPWAESIRRHWRVSRDGAIASLQGFVGRGLRNYGEQRHVPAGPGSSRLSPYLHFGQLGVRELLREVRGREGAEDYIRELLWREFAHMVLYHWPDTLDQPMDARFRNMPWRRDEDALNAWRHGRTGVPMVDAGMRELWQTGFMHNRVRMVVASYLTKHLMIDWQLGRSWFDFTLVDADPANNTLGWQWTTGSGVDAAPYFRIFNPVSQGRRFDPQGQYVRRWVPELARLPDRLLHAPWEAQPAQLGAAGICLGDDYPLPLIDLQSGRRRALDAWDRIRG